MKLPFGQIPQPPVSTAARKDGRQASWWGLALVAIGLVAIVASMFISHAANPPISEPGLVEAVTHAAVQGGHDGQPLQWVDKPPSKCPT